MRKYKVTSWHFVPNTPNGGYRITETYHAKTKKQALRQAEENWSRSRHKMTIEDIRQEENRNERMDKRN